MAKHLQEILAEKERQLMRLGQKSDIKGGIYMKKVRCGKSTCRCNNGDLHGPYPHLQWREDGKLRTKYLNRKIYEGYKKKLERNKQIDRLILQITKLKEAIAKSQKAQ